MNKHLKFEFTADKKNNTVFITKEFEAPLPLVWESFTKEEILDQWGAPEPYIAKTKWMNFEVGGKRLYAMKGPQGQEHWAIQEFTSITPTSNFKMLTNFSDSEGRISSGFQSSLNNLDFTESGKITTVNITIHYASAEILAMMIEKGFREGFTMTMENLEKVLASLQTTD